MAQDGSCSTGNRSTCPFKQAEALVYYLLVEKETFRPKLADIIWGDSADEHKVQSNMRNAIYVIRREFGRDFLGRRVEKCHSD